MRPTLVFNLAAVLLVSAASAQTTYFTGGVLRNQMWTSPDQTRANIEAGLAGRPNTDTIDLSTFDVPTSSPNIDNWGQRISGLFIPATSGNYVFFCSSDDDGDLFLSTDDSPAHKRLIAQESGWSNAEQWTAIGGGTSLASQKRSDQWTNSAGVAVSSNGIPLVAGRKYWIEYVKHDGSGGDDAGVTFKLVGDPDPANSTPSALTGNLIGYGFTIAATMPVTAQVTNTTAYAGREATFTYRVTSPIPDPLVTDGLIYQWYRNGALYADNGGPQLTFPATTADNNAQYQCVVSVNPVYGSSLSSTSAVGTLTVNNASALYTNGLKIERFLNASRSDVENNSTGPANSIFVSLKGAEGPLNDSMNLYAQRMSGWFIPPADGNYVFFLSSDDDADLFFSSDDTAGNKRLIAQETVYSNSREWVSSAGSSELSQKRSDQWTNGLGETPYYSGFPLSGGKLYYIEAVSHQGTGGDNLAVLAQLAGAPDPTNGTPPIPASQLALRSSVATTLTWISQPHNTTVFEGGNPIFSGQATSDSEFMPLYQWTRSGTNVPGATGSSYSITATPADNGAVFALVAATAEGGLSITSAPVTLTVQQAVFEKGLALMRYWANKVPADFAVGEAGGFGEPDFQMAVPSFEAGINNENGHSYVNQISGFFIPATSGAYDFFISGDDHCDLFLSTDANPNNKRLICQQPGWCNQLKWVTDEGGGADLNQKRSSTWTNPAGVALFASGIQMTAGNRYYLEAWHDEDGGGDSVAVTVVKHNDPAPADGTDSAITGNTLGFNAPNTATYVSFTNQPVGQTVLSGTPATFTAGAISDGPIPIGTTGLFNQGGDVTGLTNFVKFPNVLFQWYKNGALIPGAITSTYTTPALKPADNNAQFTVQVRTLGIANWSTSSVAVLTVIADTNPPTAYAAEFDQAGLPVLTVSFSKMMDLATITNLANYTLVGGGTSIWEVDADTNDARHVQLKLTAPPTGPMTLSLAGITDFSGNAPASPTLAVAIPGLINVDVGDMSIPDPAWQGYMWVDGPGSFTIKAQGSDIWNATDAFNFSYELKTGDFDVVVRQISGTDGLSNNSKGGLMAREDLSPVSRDWTMNNQPKAGANSTESNARVINGQATAGWATGPSTQPAYPNAWLRLKRTGQILEGFWSTNGSMWTRQASTDVSTNGGGQLPQSLYVGIDVCSHLNDSLSATVLTSYYTGIFSDYNSSYVAPTNVVQSSLSAAISGGNIVISWAPAGGTLQSSSTLGAGATWAPVGTANPATVPISTGAKFFRVSQ